MKEFMYLFRGGDSIRNEQSAEQMQIHMQKWGAWMQELTAENYLVQGEPLQDAGMVVAGKDKVVTDGPFTAGKEIVGGYLIVKANDLDHATNLSKGCPIFEHEGLVEIREILPMDL